MPAAGRRFPHWSSSSTRLPGRRSRCASSPRSHERRTVTLLDEKREPPCPPPHSTIRSHGPAGRPPRPGWPPIPRPPARPGVLAPCGRLHRRADPVQPGPVSSTGPSTWPDYLRRGSTASSPAARRTSSTSSARSRSSRAFSVPPRAGRSATFVVAGVALRDHRQPADRRPAGVLGRGWPSPTRASCSAP